MLNESITRAEIKGINIIMDRSYNAGFLKVGSSKIPKGK